MDLANFYVLKWDLNQDKLVFYDILPFFRDCLNYRKQQLKKWKRTKWWKERMEENPEDITCCPIDTWYILRAFIKNEAFYRFWGKCEYEILISDWPKQKTIEKIDIYSQIELNLDVITDILYKEIC